MSEIEKLKEAANEIADILEYHEIDLEAVEGGLIFQCGDTTLEVETDDAINNLRK